MIKHRVFLSTIVLLVFALVLGGCFGPRLSQLNGTVKRQDGTAVAQATVTLGSMSSKTDSRGAFSFKNVKLGDYVLQVIIDNNVVHSETVTIGSKPATINVVLPDIVKYGAVTGTVVDEEENAIAGATVAVDTLSIQSVTDANGKYTLADVPYGTHNVVVRRDGQPVSSSDVTVNADSITHNITVPSQVERVAVVGSLERDDGSPVVGATVRIAGVATETDAAGRFTLEEVLVGSHTLFVSIQGRDVHSESVSVEAGAELKIVMQLADVTGSIKTHTGSPLGGAVVGLNGLTELTDAQGNFDFVDIPYGSHVLTVQVGGETIHSEHVTVDQSVVSLDVTVQYPTLPVTLDPLLDEHVELLEPMFGTPLTTRQDPTGEHVFYMGTQVATIPGDTNTDIRYVLFTYDDLEYPVLSFDSRGGAEGSGNPSHFVIFGWEDYRNYYYAYVAESAATRISRVVNGVNQDLYRHGSIIWYRDRENYNNITLQIREENGSHVVDTYVNGSLEMTYTFKQGEEPPKGRVGIGMWNLTHSAYMKNISLADE